MILSAIFNVTYGINKLTTLYYSFSTPLSKQTYVSGFSRQNFLQRDRSQTQFSPHREPLWLPPLSLVDIVTWFQLCMIKHGASRSRRKHVDSAHLPLLMGPLNGLDIHIYRRTTQFIAQWIRCSELSTMLSPILDTISIVSRSGISCWIVNLHDPAELN